MNSSQILVTGGAGYVGSALVPKMLAKGYRVKVLDWYIYGDDVFKSFENNPNLVQIKGDIRDRELLRHVMPGCDAVIHLACISDDPSYEINPQLGKSVNYDAFSPMVAIAKVQGVKRFIYASSSSVYGIKKVPEVTEDMPLEPLTDYSKYKAKCEDILMEEAAEDFAVTIIRPAIVCGYSPRLRLDLTVNILTNHAVNKGQIKVFGGKQMRPNIHIEDMTDLYIFILEQPKFKIHKKTYNVSYENYTVSEIAEIVNRGLGGNIPIYTIPTDDEMSYHVCSDKIMRELQFSARHSIEEAVQDLKRAFDDGLISDSFENIRYYNIKTMQNLQIH